MKTLRFILLYVVLLVAQIILCNYFTLARYLLVSVLPVLILLLPRHTGTIAAMFMAFACGFAVDFFSTGMLGISSLALVPVALVRRGLLVMVFGDEQNDREDELTIARFGLPQVLLAVLFSNSIFFFVYIWADSAGTVGFWPAALRFLLSVLVSTPIGALVVRLLRPE